VSIKSGEVPFLVVIGKTISGTKLWPFEECRKSLCFELFYLRFLRRSSVQVDLTNFSFIISFLTVGIILLHMQTKLQRTTSK